MLDKLNTHDINSVCHSNNRRMRKLWFKRGRICLMLSILCVFVMVINFEGYSRHIYKFLYDHFDTIYYFHVDRPHFCCTVYQGGLGNLLFQYSFSYMIAKNMNLTLLIPDQKLKLIQDVFQVPNVTSDPRGLRVCQSTYKYKDKTDVGFDGTVFQIPNNTDIHFDGYFQSWVYWKEFEDELREQIKFHPSIIVKSKQLLNDALSKIGKVRKNLTLVGIHVRRGDMITKEYFKDYGYNVANEKYLEKAMKYISDRVSGEIVFIVCSNDMTWTKEAIKVPNAVFINGTRREYDMAVLTLCDHFIMTVGTFGWWTGYLLQSDGIIIYFDTPFRSGTALEKNWAKDYKKTFFFPKWIGLS